MHIEFLLSHCPVLFFLLLTASCFSIALACVFQFLLLSSSPVIYTSHFFHSIIPSFLFTGPSLPSPLLLSPLSLFNVPLDVNCLLWLSFSISPSSFLSFIYLFIFCSPSVPYPAINKNLYHCWEHTGRRGKETPARSREKHKERSEWPSDEVQECEHE